MPYVKESVWLRRETSVDNALRRAEVLFAQMGMNLGVTADFMEMAQEAFLED